MITNLYCVKDALNGFSSPFVDPNNDSAIRGFCMALRDAKAGNILGFVPTDFSLWHLGTFDTTTGVLTSEPVQIFYGGDFNVNSSSL